MQSIVKLRYATLLELLNKTYRCQNCSQPYKLFNSIGSWTCKYHPGTFTGRTWSCCNAGWENSYVQRGCTECDHWSNTDDLCGHRPLFQLPLEIYDTFQQTDMRELKDKAIVAVVESTTVSGSKRKTLQISRTLVKTT